MEYEAWCQLPAEERPAAWGAEKAKLAASRGSNDGYMFPWMRKAMTDAYARAGISGPDDVDAFETHDCFSITELVAIEHFGIAPPGRAREAIERGDIAADGACPVNPSGGLIGLGHPVGATGVKQVLEIFRQMKGQCGDYQVPNVPEVGACGNLGGDDKTCIVTVLRNL